MKSFNAEFQSSTLKEIYSIFVTCERGKLRYRWSKCNKSRLQPDYCSVTSGHFSPYIVGVQLPPENVEILGTKMATVATIG
jgi:hypothetical protein